MLVESVLVLVVLRPAGVSSGVVYVSVVGDCESLARLRIDREAVLTAALAGAESDSEAFRSASKGVGDMLRSVEVFRWWRRWKHVATSQSTQIDGDFVDR